MYVFLLGEILFHAWNLTSEGANFVFFFGKQQIEAIVQDASANGVIFNIHALNLSLDGQVINFFAWLHIADCKKINVVLVSC